MGDHLMHMQTFSFDELPYETRVAITSRYYADTAYQAFLGKVVSENPEDFADVGDWAEETGMRFTFEGAHVSEEAIKAHEKNVKTARVILQAARENGNLSVEACDLLSSFIE